MLGSISPVGESSRQQRWWLTASAYLVASLIGGALIGGVVGGAGQLLGVASVSLPVRLLVLAVAVAVAALLDTGVLGWSLPTWHRQVDERWLGTYRGWVYGAGFGLQLGLGVATIVTSAVTYAMLVAAALTGSLQAGALIGVAFGAVRALPLLLTGMLRSPADLHRVTGSVVAAEARVHRIVIAGQAAIAAAAVAGAAL